MVPLQTMRNVQSVAMSVSTQWCPRYSRLFQIHNPILEYATSHNEQQLINAGKQLFNDEG